MSRPPERRIVVPNYSGSGKSHKEQLRDMAEAILEQMRNSINDPKAFNTYADNFARLDKLLGGELSTEKKAKSEPVDVSAFEE